MGLNIPKPGGTLGKFVDKTKEAVNHTKKKVGETAGHTKKKIDETAGHTKKKLNETGRYLGDRTGLGRHYEDTKKKVHEGGKHLEKKIDEAARYLGDRTGLGEIIEQGKEAFRKWLKELLSVSCPLIYYVVLQYYKIYISRTDVFFYLKEKKINLLQNYYPTVQLNEIKFSFIPIDFGRATAFSPYSDTHYVFMNGEIEEGEESFKTLCHEMQHSVQYKKLGGFKPFMDKYCYQFMGEVLNNIPTPSGVADVNKIITLLDVENSAGKIYNKIHDAVELEEGASNRAQEILDSLKTNRITCSDCILSKDDFSPEKFVVNKPLAATNTIISKGINTVQVKINNVAEDVVTTVHSVIAETVKNKITESVQEIVEDSIQEIVSDTVQDMVSNIVQDMDKSLENIADTVGDRVKKRFS